MKDSVILCEKCVKADRCMVLKPCKDYAPEQSSNFLSEVAVVLSKQQEKELVYS